jgi:hypothetical protein
VSLAFKPPQPERAADTRLEELAAAVLIGDHASSLALVRAWALDLSPRALATAFRHAGISDRAGDALDALVSATKAHEAEEVNHGGIEAQLAYCFAQQLGLDDVLAVVAEECGCEAPALAAALMPARRPLAGATPSAPACAPTDATKIYRGSSIRRLGLPEETTRKIVGLLGLRAPRIGNLCRETARQLAAFCLTPGEIGNVRIALGRYGWALAEEEPYGCDS